VSDRHLVLVGLNYTPRRGTGDKNFWADLVPALAPDLDRISIVSVLRGATTREHVTLDGCEIETRYVDAALLGSIRMPRVGARSGGPRGGSYRRMQGLLDKQLVVRRVMAEVSGILRDHPGQAVHLMDNFGPANRFIARAGRRLGARTSVTATGYERRGRLFYDWFLSLSYAGPEIRVVAQSYRLEQRLGELGVGARRLTRIPWGVRVDGRAGDEVRKAIRTRLGVPLDRPLFLWAGFIQQVREPDFHAAFRLATEARDRGLDATFLFAFKPETFRSEYAGLHRPDLGIHVMATPVELFADVRAASDILFSPIINRNSIVAPPLTWIESMGAGLPVLTTDVPGADELVVNGTTGYLARDEAELLEKLFALRDEHARMQEACRAKVAEAYNLEDIQRAYLKFWFGDAT